MRTGESLERSRGRRAHGNRARKARLLALVIALIVVCSSVAAPVAAHAYLSDSDPANGERVETVPDEVTLTFGGDGVQVADVTVTGPDGEDVSGDAVVGADDSRIVRVPLKEAADGDDAEGMYTVRWEILADDGHETGGSFVFSVGDEPLDRDAVLAAYEDDEGADESAPPVETAAKGLLLVALVCLVGGPATAALAVYPVAGRFGASTNAVDRRLTRLFATAGGLLVVSVLALGLSRAASAGPPSLETLVEFAGMSLGRAWLIQLVLAAALVIVLALAVAGAAPRRVWLPGTFVGAVYVGAAVGWTSHSATAIDQLRGTVVDLAHVGGAGLWVGGLVVLALAVPALLRETAPADRAALAVRAIRRYSLLALSGVTLAAATGLVLAAWHVPDLAALGASVYGVALSAKTLLVLLALGLGGFTRFVLLRRLEAPTDGARGAFAERLFGGGETDAGARVREDGGRTATGDRTITAFTRAVRLEVGVLVLIVLLSGLLTSVPTVAVVSEDEGLETATIKREGDVDVALTATPAERAGGVGETDERFTVREGDPVVFEAAFTDGDETLESERTVRLLADGADGDRFGVDLEETDDGTYTTVRTLPADGDWRVRVTGEPDGQYVDEWFDVHVLSDEADESHAHGEDADHDHGDEDHDHDGEDEAERDDRTNASAFATLLQFGAVSIGVIGSVAVAVEAVRFRERDD